MWETGVGNLLISENHETLSIFLTKLYDNMKHVLIMSI